MTSACRSFEALSSLLPYYIDSGQELDEKWSNIYLGVVIDGVRQLESHSIWGTGTGSQREKTAQDANQQNHSWRLGALKPEGRLCGNRSLTTADDSCPLSALSLRSPSYLQL